MTRDRVRRLLLVGGLLPLLLALVLTVLVGRMALLQHRANTAYAEGRFPDAAHAYRGAGRFTPFEDWIAAFDAGAARHAGGDYAAAVEDYRAALASGVPRREECTVRINLALADEAIGDAAAKADKLDDADEAYRSGIAALEDGGCPHDAGRGEQQTKDAKAVDERLRRKLQHDAQQKKQQQSRKKDQQPQDQQQKQEQKRKEERQRREQQKREDQLQQLNGQGAEKRQRDQDQGEGFGYVPSW
jgi:tetratricopeptide (TPR) repeat protein